MGIALDRKALVTGGASGFGLETVRRLRAAGAALAVVDVDRGRLDEVLEDIGEDILAIEADVRSPEAMRNAVETCRHSLGGLDTLVLCAGVIHVKPLDDVTEDDWDFTLDVNLKGVFFACQAAAQALRESGRGRIVAIASDAGHRGFGGIQAYCASKFGVVGLVESLAVELGSSSVTVNCVCPVACPSTGMGQRLLDWKVKHFGKTPEEVLRATAQGNVLQRNATESDITEAILFFISDEASFLTGVALDVDGGAHLGLIPGN